MSIGNKLKSMFGSHQHHPNEHQAQAQKHTQNQHNQQHNSQQAHIHASSVPKTSRVSTSSNSSYEHAKNTASNTSSSSSPLSPPATQIQSVSSATTTSAATTGATTNSSSSNTSSASSSPAPSKDRHVLSKDNHTQQLHPKLQHQLQQPQTQQSSASVSRSASRSGSVSSSVPGSRSGSVSGPQSTTSASVSRSGSVSHPATSSARTTSSTSVSSTSASSASAQRRPSLLASAAGGNSQNSHNSNTNTNTNKNLRNPSVSSVSGVPPNVNNTHSGTKSRSNSVISPMDSLSSATSSLTLTNTNTDSHHPSQSQPSPPVVNSVTECHTAVCLLVPSNWNMFPKSVATQLKNGRFVLLEGVDDSGSTMISNNESSATINTNNTHHNGAPISVPSTANSSTANMSSLLNSTLTSSHNPLHALHTPHVPGMPLEISQLGHHLHFLRSARRLEKLGGMLREMMGTGKKVRDDAMSALPDLGLDPFQLNSAIDGGKGATTTNNNNNGGGGSNNGGNTATPPKKGNGTKRGNLSLMSSLIAQIERGERDVNSVVKGVSPASQLGTNISLNTHQPFPDSNCVTPTPSTASTPAPLPQSLLQKYGKCQEVVGKGTYGIVRVAHKFDKTLNRETLFAVKEFKRRTQESDLHFSKRLTSEFCISSSLHDNNIIHTLDLMKDGRGEYCQVMEFCDGGDLYSMILASEGGLKQAEADCFFKQLVRGVVYMHSMGVAHCDLKPENLLLTCNGSLKISDFGNAECFQMAWETEVHLSSGICGSRPYIAPEQFKDREFDPRAVDVWACGVIYMVMRTGSYLWQVANVEEDVLYEKYLVGRKQKNGFEPIEALRRARCRNVIYSILDPIPSRRITGKQILNSEWGRSIHVCNAGERGF